MACKIEDVNLVFLDRKDAICLPLVEVDSCEDLWRLAARKILNVKPAGLELFGLKCNQNWLSPSESVPQNQKIEFRLRFKPPHAGRLKEADKATFRYFYAQVRHDFDNGTVLREIAKDINKDYNSKIPKWYLPVINNNNHEATKKRVKFLTTIVTIVSLNIVIDTLTGDGDKETVMKNFEAYVPKQIWASMAEKKMIGMRELKQTTTKIVDKLLGEKAATSVDQRKLEFLNMIEANFKEYYYELFSVRYGSLHCKELEDVVIKLVPPFKLKLPPCDENEAYLAIFDSKKSETKLCNVEEICNISTTLDNKGVNIEIARKNGIPLYLIVKDEPTAWSLLTALTGYYRLCEKWIFCLCPDVVYPSLNNLQAAKVHGPVDSQFVMEKFKAAPERQQPGTYLIRRSCDNHFTYFLHYVIVSGISDQGMTERSLKVLHILQSEETKMFSLIKQDIEPSINLQNIEECYADLANLIKDITGPLGLKTCLHPSEYDRAASLLVCRSESALGNDIFGQDRQGAHEKVFIPIAALSRIENVKIMKGRFTKVWKALWAVSGDRKEVAIKQLKHNDSHLMPFMHMCNDAMLWSDSTLIKVFGTVLATPGNPMALVMEYLPMGPLNLYLQKNKTVSTEHLLEAAVSLARALLHLEEQNIVHGNIRLRNVLVAQHEESLKVKLGDPGLPDYSCPEEVHWLSFELLVDSCPTPSKCTNKSDVWAFATTLWELFSFGELPSLDPVYSKEQYLNGHRLAMPGILRGGIELSSIYGVMQGCWNPMPGGRTSPHAILRDLNQLLYKVFNAKKVHTYVTLNDSTDTSPTHEASGGATSTDGTVIYLSSEEASTPEMMRFNPHLSFDSSDESLQSFGQMPKTSNKLAPLFTNWMQQHFGRLGQGSSWTESHQNLIMDSSRSASSCSVVNSFSSQFTVQTSISSLSQYSVSVYQINETQISLNKDRPLGEGNFGIVYKGVWTKSNGEWEEVAVKMLKDFNDPASEEEIERELNMMRRLDHDNIVRIHGAFSVADTGNTAFAMEFVREGSLDNYLRTHKNNIKVPLQLFIFADNICEGMIYLSREGLIHRDLAARNILVASDERVKISDFGLARQPQGKDYYTMSSHTNIPVKWMAVESLSHGIFHTPSDVWSFGVVLWEMFTFGESPYLENCEDFFKADQSDEKLKAQMEEWIQNLLEGKRFPRPEACPAILYSEVMYQCWHPRPENRPSFFDLKNHLTRIEKQVT